MPIKIGDRVMVDLTDKTFGTRTLSYNTYLTWHTAVGTVYKINYGMVYVNLDARVLGVLEARFWPEDLVKLCSR
jgi:hypothetical protein